MLKILSQQWIVLKQLNKKNNTDADSSSVECYLYCMQQSVLTTHNESCSNVYLHNTIIFFTPTSCGFLRYSSIVYCPKNTHRFDCSRNIFENFNHMNTHRFLLGLLKLISIICTIKNCGKPTDQLHQLRSPVTT